jgi:hypothetical protein
MYPPVSTSCDVLLPPFDDIVPRTTQLSRATAFHVPGLHAAASIKCLRPHNSDQQLQLPRIYFT